MGNRLGYIRIQMENWDQTAGNSTLLTLHMYVCINIGRWVCEYLILLWSSKDYAYIHIYHGACLLGKLRQLGMYSLTPNQQN